MMDNLFMIFGALVVSFSFNLGTLLFGRFLCGHVCASMLVNIPAYTSEICQPEVRKLTGGFIMLTYSFGFSTMIALGAVFEWRTACRLVTVFPAVVLVFLAMVPESPIWLLIVDRDDDAKVALTKLRGDSMVVEHEFSRIKDNLKELAVEELDEDHGCCGCSDIFAALTDKAFLKPFGILLVLFAVGFEWTGLPFIGFYAVTVMAESGIPLDPYWMAAGLTGYRAVLIAFASGLSTKCRRRPMFINACLLSTCGLFCLALFFHFNLDGSLVQAYPLLVYSPVACIMAIYTGFSLGFGQVPYMLQGEILPPYSRAIGSGLLGFLDNISLSISTKMAPSIAASWGYHGAFYLYAGLSLFVAIFAYCFVPETFGLSLEEISKIYQTNSDQSKGNQQRSRRSSSVFSFYESSLKVSS